MTSNDPVLHYILEVHVTTNARKTVITERQGNVLWMDVHAKPEHNKANDEIVRYLTRELGRQVVIKAGKTSKHKLIECRDRANP